MGSVAPGLPPSKWVAAVEASWTGREDYARTCREWARRLQANQAEAISLVGEETVHDWLRYLKMSARAFDVSALGLWRYQLKRNQRSPAQIE